MPHAATPPFANIKAQGLSKDFMTKSKDITIKINKKKH